MKTFMAKPGSFERKWHIIDATNLPVGRLATAVADTVSGKNKVIYTPHVDTGDFVIVINTDKMVLTGKKLEQKKMRWHTGFIGGLKETGYDKLMKENSPKVLLHAVKGMLPKNTQGRKQLTRVKVFATAEHTHEAQQPEILTVKGARN